MLNEIHSQNLHGSLMQSTKASKKVEKMEQLDKTMTKNTEIHVLIQVDQDAKRENLAALEDQKLNF